MRVEGLGFDLKHENTHRSPKPPSMQTHWLGIVEELELGGARLALLFRVGSSSFGGSLDGVGFGVSGLDFGGFRV